MKSFKSYPAYNPIILSHFSPVFQCENAVNNAGIINRRAKIWDLSAAEVDAVIDTNLKGTINVIRHFLPLMKQGTIVNFSSVWGRVGDADVSCNIFVFSFFYMVKACILVPWMMKGR